MRITIFLRIWKMEIFIPNFKSKQGGKSSNTLGFSNTNVQHFIK